MTDRPDAKDHDPRDPAGDHRPGPGDGDAPADGGHAPGDDGTGGPPSLWRRIASSPAYRWSERAVFLVLVGFLLYKLGPQISALTGVRAGAGFAGDAPAFQAVTLDGDTVRSHQLRGRVVVVNFWATWCPPCRLEMPSLQALHEAHPDDELVVLGLSTDAGSAAPVRRFLDEHGITYPVARADRRLRSAFGGITGIPTTFILDRGGRVRHRVVGYFLPPAMTSAVGRLLDEETAAPGG